MSQNLSSLSPIRTAHTYSSSYVKQPVYQGNTYVNITPPRLTPVMLGTPSTAQTVQTVYSVNNSAPNRFNQALDQVCMLGHEMDTMRKNFELVQVELEQWKEKCGLIKAIAQTPPPGTNYSPTRVTRLKSDVQNQFQNYQQEINKLNSILQSVSSDLTSSSDKIRSLERRVEEMNRIELEMLQAKKTALELDNQNRFQALTLNDLKSKVDSTSSYNMELEKKLAIIPHLQENIQILEEENRKMAAIIQSKDDQIQRQDSKHIQITRMYQENLEKTNQIATQLREALNENEELHGEVDRTHNIAESLKEVNVQNSIYLQKQQPQQSQQQRLRSSASQGRQEEQFDANDLKGSYSQNKLEGSLNRGDSLQRSQSSVSQSRNARNSAKLSQVQSAMLDQQTNIDQLQTSIRDKDQRLQIGEKEKQQLMNQISDLNREIGNLKNQQIQQQAEHEDSLMKQKREYSDDFQNQIIPLQSENSQMRQEIEALENEIANVKASLQHVQEEKALLEEQMNKERQQSYNIQQKLSKDNEMKCDQLTERLIAKEGDLSEERLKNKELFEDNKLMAEEMRILKQKAAELELWKNKYRDLKKETKALRSQFEEYKQNFIREIQTRFSSGCDQFDNCLKFIDEKFDSARNTAQIQQQLLSQPQESNINTNSNVYQQSPVRTYSQNSDGSDLKRNQRTLSPAQERLKVMKLTPSRSSAVNVRSSSPYVDSTNSQGSGQQYQQQQGKGEILSGQASKYQKEITQTNEQLDNKLGELVILKAKYEEALNRVQQNINSTPKK